jgi:hypothetical protein
MLMQQRLKHGVEDQCLLMRKRKTISSKDVAFHSWAFESALHRTKCQIILTHHQPATSNHQPATAEHVTRCHQLASSHFGAVCETKVRRILISAARENVESVLIRLHLQGKTVSHQNTDCDHQVYCATMNIESHICSEELSATE